MRFRTVRLDGQLTTVVVANGSYAVLDPGRSVDESLRNGALAELAGAAPRIDNLPIIPSEGVRIEALVHRPRKLWGIGLNYQDHAGDLSETAPTEPASFLKGDHTLIGADDRIIIPADSTRTTAEAELGLVIGREAYQIGSDDPLDYVAGVCLILDQTEEEILRRNPRFLTRAKNFPSFLSVGPDLITFDEALAHVSGDIDALTVETRRNGELVRSNQVRNMTFSPRFLVEFHSAMMPLYPGDIISTGTPGAVVVTPGDVVECVVVGIGTLSNPVIAASDPQALRQNEELIHV